MSKTVRIVGMDQFIKEVYRKQSGIDQAVSQEIARSVLRVEKRAKTWAPWDTGWLANNIYSQMTHLLTGEVVSPVEYSIYVEDGTRYMMAQPFMYPALKTEWPILRKNLQKLMGG
ncbi:HK97-gp10 family putative phage morphogenesis protein [Enterococcus mediterraneensis]|uniref:HK97-gp10 family putative phage morphogenesis protein n=1 Tax=Enterococcus mediterraneensis TaxID=2364791 RepID=UPI000F0619C9|nr:HK97-gp10 family putative phage morphogenesis protein [Enterococcus mediterraneensis]